jgi:hypothetical protein
MTQPYRLENQHKSYNERLKRAFPFTDADLDANRAGKLTQGQYNRLRDAQEGIACLGWYSVLICLFAVLCSSLMNLTEKPKDGSSDLSFLAMLMVIVVPMIAFLVLSQPKAPQDIQSIHVMSHQGRMVGIRSHGRASVYIVIDQMSLDISSEAAHAFVVNEEYIVYYTGNIPNAISAEHVLKLPTSSATSPDPSNPLTTPVSLS